MNQTLLLYCTLTRFTTGCGLDIAESSRQPLNGYLIMTSTPGPILALNGPASLSVLTLEHSFYSVSALLHAN
jgi:hypothetical protein